MRIPPLYRLPGWQRFLAGAALGGLVSWLIFFYMFGILQEKQISMIMTQETEIEDLRKTIEILKEEADDLNELAESKMVIEDIQVRLVNSRIFDEAQRRLSTAQVQDMIRDDLQTQLTKDVESVYKVKDLLKKSIENKTIEMNKKRYQAEVTEIFFYSTLSIEVKLKQIK
ncbi:sporulation protein [Bacillus sp. M6-12]|uniref:sporulation membrane protein YtrI n=1 Tax=Bacillus sp. M6-12 TaxID=2054166 RepID=UPI000C7641D3|nr:sporulation membrane protein YtrI [Bacillus sp. M6-12]PLS16976.1 sporulation protein [Bacillus sp. M6-12]